MFKGIQVCKILVFLKIYDARKRYLSVKLSPQNTDGIRLKDTCAA